MPRIGDINGATIIAPITVAVESPATPAPAMIADSTSNNQKRLVPGGQFVAFEEQLPAHTRDILNTDHVWPPRIAAGTSPSVCSAGGGDARIREASAADLRPGRHGRVRREPVTPGSA